MSRRAATRIVTNVHEEFDALRADLRRHLGPDADVDHARRLLAEHVPAMVVGRAQLLLETLLSYLMEDAIEALRNAPTPTKNEFYDLDLRTRIKDAFKLEPESLQFSFDPRAIAGIVAAGGTAAAGGVVTVVLLSSFLLRIAGGLATLVASALAFRTAYTATAGTARRRLREDVHQYVARSERQVSMWLATVEEAFVSAFEEFLGSRSGPAEGGA